jgi:acyl dehydratase
VSLDLGVVGRQLPSTPISWTSQDAILYALGVGAGAADPHDELELTTENSAGVEQVVLPGFGCTLAQRAGLVRHLEGVDPAVVLHAEQSLEYFRALPPEGEAIATPLVEAIYDKGRSALVRFATTVAAPDGVPYLTSRAGLFLRGLGGWGGDRGPTSQCDTPDRAPDAVLHSYVRPDLALLYRLSGDRNPLHSDPVTARRAGFDRPILHGLCTLGISVRMMLRKFSGDADGNVRYNGLRSLSCRMSAPVLPGQTLAISAWQEDDVLIRFEVSVNSTGVIERAELSLAGEESP